jgi:hypothetical protein
LYYANSVSNCCITRPHVVVNIRPSNCCIIRPHVGVNIRLMTAVGTVSVCLHLSFHTAVLLLSFSLSLSYTHTYIYIYIYIIEITTGPVFSLIFAEDPYSYYCIV